MTPIAEKALEIARAQIGVSEEPKNSNRGPQVDQYIRSVGLDPAGKYPWCMAFVYWCFDQAGKAVGVINPMFKTGGVLDQFNKRKNVHQVQTPRPGDVIILDYGAGKGHTGIVEMVHENGTVGTIEGNTNDEGSREGYEVCRRKRNVLKAKFLRF